MPATPIMKSTTHPTTPDTTLLQQLEEMQVRVQRPVKDSITELEKRTRPPEMESHWYQFEGLIPYQDLLLCGGFCCVVGCIALFSWRISIGVLGAGVMALAWMLGRAR